MPAYLKSDIWKKAYLVEFYDKDSKNVEDSFTFSAQSESEELSYSQHKSETKIFGGLHVDDYGVDTLKITLSGSTINRDLKRIYRAKKSDEWLSGDAEIYRLRDKIVEYKSGDKIGYKIMFYDLSKINYIKGCHIKNYWRVFPGDFTIRRSNDRPFTYQYGIEFTAARAGESEYNDDILAPKIRLQEPPWTRPKRGWNRLKTG